MPIYWLAYFASCCLSISPNMRIIYIRRKPSNFFSTAFPATPDARKSYARAAFIYYLPSCHSKCSMSIALSIIIYDLQLTAAAQKSFAFLWITFSESNILCHPERDLVDIHRISAANTTAVELSAAANFRSLNICGRVSICGARPPANPGAIIYAFAFVFIASEFMGAAMCAKNT